MSTPLTPLTPPTTDDLVHWDRAFLWHPFTPMKPWVENKDIVVIERGEREFLIDTDGRRYIDGVSSMWCNVHGHAVPELDAAVNAQLRRIAHTSLLGMASVPSVLLAKRLVELAQACGLRLSKLFYSDNGSTAVEVACKMACQYWANLGRKTRTRFIALENAYHGDTIGAVSVGGIPLFHEVFKSLCFAVDFIPSPLTSPATRAPGPAAEAEIARITTAFEKLLAARPDQYAALIIEPLVQGAGGMIMHPPGLLAALRKLADRHNILLIADEVMTGFGRTGAMFACQQEAVTPDLLCLSKGLTAGYMPLGVTLATQQIYDAFYDDPRAAKTFFHGHTFTGHPLACAVALASLDLFEKNRLLDHAARLGGLMDECLAPLAGRPFVGDVRRRGLIGAVELVADPATREAFPYFWRVGGALCTQMRARGVMLRPLADVLVIMPPLAITPENLRHLCAAVVESVQGIPEIIRQKRQEFGS